VSAFSKALEIGKANSEFCPVNEKQEKFLSTVFSSRSKDLELFSAEELCSIAAFTADEINKFLKSKGFFVELSPFQNPHDYGVASVMDVLVEWTGSGDESTLYTASGKKVASGNVTTGVKFYTSQNHNEVVAEISCKNGDTFCMSIADKEREDLDLLQFVNAINLDKNKKIETEFGGVHYPMIDYNQEVDISYFKGMSFEGHSHISGESGKYSVVEAKQQTMLRMNQAGARAKSSVAMSMMFESCAIPRPSLKIDRPFFVWANRKDLTLPYFAGYMTEKDWKKPEWKPWH
jgi:hypothetical protein